MLSKDQSTQKIIGYAEIKNGLYQLHLPNHTASAQSAITAPHSDPVIWHFRLGHTPFNKLSSFPISFDNKSCNNITPCDICHFSKQKKLSFTDSTSHAIASFDLVHMDIWGPFSTASYSGFKYFLTIVDDHTRCTWTFMMKTKSETRFHIMNFYKLIQTQFDKKIKIIRTDNGAEFMFSSFYQSNGIIHQLSCVETPQQNGRVERKHQHILQIARSLLFQSCLPITFWSDCVLSAVHIINRTPTAILDNKSPFELLYNTIPDYSHLKVFGCLAYASTLTANRNKFDPRASKCVFIGYPFGYKGYKLYDLNTHKIFVSRHVQFYENIFPYKDILQKSYNSSNNDNTSTDNHTVSTDQSYATSTQVNSNSFIDNQISEEFNTINYNIINDSSESTNTSSFQDDMNIVDPETSPQRKSSRVRSIPTYLHNYDYSLPDSIKPTHQSSCNLIRYPISNHISDNRLDQSYKCFTASISLIKEPKTYKQAIKYPEWQTAMNTELQALEQNNTWTLVNLPPQQHTVGCKWVYKTKLKSDGTLERYKARLVAKGYTQEEGLDYFDTFSPVVKLTTVRLLLAIATTKHWFLQQLDINNAFLHGDLLETIYMQPPPGYLSPGDTRVCKLQKSLYGLKQASRQWYYKLSECLQGIGYIQSQADFSLFTKSNDNSITVLLLYVDDIILAGNDKTEINYVKDVLHNTFTIKDLGDLKYILGIEVARSEKGICLSQRKYTLDILSENGYLNCKPYSTPMDSKIKLSKENGTALSDPKVYRTLIGKLLYLTVTRPDIAYSVQTLSQFLAKPTDIHLNAAHRILRYLKNAPGKGLFYSINSDLKLSGYSDSDWAGCVDTRRSVSGYCFYLGNSLISWKSKKQQVVSRSSTESEYRAAANAVCEAQWLHYLLKDFKIQHLFPINLHIDNQSTYFLAHNPVQHQRTKHIELDCHLLREKISTGLINLKLIKNHCQLADVYTKALGNPLFEEFTVKMNLLDIHAHLEGGYQGVQNNEKKELKD
ncbi:unnamed protein product [Cuscuta epithymum]|uniref:Integrase catalytic domain-containing protein n=1 Tax=Cuscuta epithymum TaxID=186058 RepID=A0AAV0CP22_9ASTE|nr:unnamed protein product [Cuscuta epithymum]